VSLSLSSVCRIVFAVARGIQGDGELRRACGETVDWERVLALVTVNKAAGALDSALTRLADVAVPAAPREQIRRQRMVSDFHSAYLRQRLLQTLTAFRSNGVDVLLLKGAALGAVVYESAAARPMADIDLLIRPQQRAAAGAALGISEWKAELDPVRADLYTEHHHLPPFLDARGSGHRLEVHVAPFPPPNPFASVDESMWEQALPAPSEFSGAMVPSRAHMLVYACVHFAWSHMITRGAWRTFRDIEALSDAGVDWQEVVATARSWKAESSCYWTLRLAHTLSRVGAVAAPVLASLRPPMPRLVEQILERHFVAQVVPGERATCPSTKAVELLWEAAIRPRWRGHGRQRRKSGGSRWRALRHHDAAPGVEEVRKRGLGAWGSYFGALGSDKRSATSA
jgi:hypothetical protein